MNKGEIRRYLKDLNAELKKEQVFSILESVYPCKLIEPKSLLHKYEKRPVCHSERSEESHKNNKL